MHLYQLSYENIPGSASVSWVGSHDADLKQLQRHRVAWVQLLQSGQPGIIRDYNCTRSADAMQTSIASLPSDTDVAILEYSGSDVLHNVLLAALVSPLLKRRTMMHVSGDWWVPGFCVGIRAYVVTPTAAAALLKTDAMKPLDVVLNQSTALRMYCMKHSSEQSLTFTELLEQPIAVWSRGMLRCKHLMCLCATLLLVFFASRSKYGTTLGLILLSLPLAHYFGTVSHLDEASRRTAAETDDGLVHAYHVLNERLVLLNTVLVGVTAAAQGRFHSVTRLLLLMVVLKLFISSLFWDVDPTGSCDLRAMQKLHLGEYCSDLAISGHMLPPLLLARLMPALGVPLSFAQAAMIMCSESHYWRDLFTATLLVGACTTAAL